MSDRISETDIVHPSPHRERVGLVGLFFGLLAGPVAWGLQELLSYGLASHACFPSDMPLGEALAGWGELKTYLIVIDVLAILLSLAGIAVSFMNWRTSREEASGSSGELVEAGEGRTRFLSLWGVLAGGGFLVGIVFNTIAFAMVPLC